MVKQFGRPRIHALAQGQAGGQQLMPRACPMWNCDGVGLRVLVTQVLD